MYPKRRRPAVAVSQPVPQDIGKSLLPADAWAHIRVAFRLSDRELQIVQGIFAAQEQDVIARAMGVESDLVYRTTQRIYVKLRIGSKLELIARVKSEYMEFAATQPMLAYRAG